MAIKSGKDAYWTAKRGIVQDGLVLNLDAAVSDSYPGYGTTWKDLSGNNNGTLANGPTFNSENGGSLVFDGSNDYVDCGNNSSIQITKGTIFSWVKTSNPGASYRGIIAKQYAWGLFILNNVLIAYDWGNSTDRTTSINVADGTWKHVAMSFTETTGTPSNNAIIYLNGLNILQTTIKHANNNVTLQIAEGNSGQNLNGNIAQSLVYNRVLSQAEITQNYNATRKRFGL